MRGHFYLPTNIHVFFSQKLLFLIHLLFSFYVSEAKDLATSYEVKYIETSCVLKHNVDELLVGVTKQILLRKEKDESGSCSNAGAGARSSSSRVTQSCKSLIFWNIFSQFRTENIPHSGLWCEPELFWWACLEYTNHQNIIFRVIIFTFCEEIKSVLYIVMNIVKLMFCKSINQSLMLSINEWIN